MALDSRIMDEKPKGNLKIFIGAAAIVATTFAVRLPYAFEKVVNIDETIYGLIGRVILQGGVPFRDVWEIKPPNVYYLYAAVMAIFGDRSLVPVRFVSIIFAAVAALVAADIARKKWGDLAGLTAGFGLAVYSVCGPIVDNQSAETELFLMPLALLAARKYLFARPDRASRDMFVAGLFSGAAAMFKQPAAGFAIVIGVATLLNPPGGKRLKPFVAYSVGTMLWPIGFSIYFALNGAFHDFLNLAVLNNFGYMSESGRTSVVAMIVDSTRLIGGKNIALWIPGFAAATYSTFNFIVRKKRDAETRGDIFLAGNLLAGTVGAYAGVFLNGHYYLLALPWLVLFWAEFVSTFYTRARATAIRIAIVLAVAAGMIYPAGFFLIAQRPIFVDVLRPIETVTFPGLARDADSMAGDPDARIFVWGLCPEILWNSTHKPAGRFLYTTFQSGVVANAPSIYRAATASTYASQESWDRLFEDFEKYRPAVVLDASMIYKSTRPYPITMNERMKRLLDDKYEHYRRSDGFELYAIKDPQ